jgi:hypothetical protein
MVSVINAVNYSEPESLSISSNPDLPLVNFEIFSKLLLAP